MQEQFQSQFQSHIHDIGYAEPNQNFTRSETSKVANSIYGESKLADKPTSESYTIKTSIVLPPDTNHHGTMFGGKLMANIDEVATIAATRHSRRPVVTASTDSVDFLNPIKEGNSICLSAFVTCTHKTSMEVFVRVITEDLLNGNRKVCATAFLTFVALGEDGRPVAVPNVIPQSPQETRLHETALERKDARKVRRRESRLFAEYLGVDYRLGRNLDSMPQTESTQKAKQEKAFASSQLSAYSCGWDAEW
jgi:acyl-CoA hydrolase